MRSTIIEDMFQRYEKAQCEENDIFHILVEIAAQLAVANELKKKEIYG